MKKIYMIEGLVVCFYTYEEARQFLKAYNEKFNSNDINEWIFVDAIKPLYLTHYNGEDLKGEREF